MTKRKDKVKVAIRPKGGNNGGGHKGPSGTTTTGKVTNVPVDMSGWRREVLVSRLKFDDDQKNIYLAALREHGLKGKAAQAAGVSNNTVQRHRENDPDFGEAEANANQEYTDKLITHHQNLLFNGEVHRTFDKEGIVISEKHVHPIQLIAMELKKRDPTYSEKHVVDIKQGAGGVLVVPAEISVEDYLQELEAKKAEEELEDNTIDITPEQQEPTS